MAHCSVNPGQNPDPYILNSPQRVSANNPIIYPYQHVHGQPSSSSFAQSQGSTVGQGCYYTDVPELYHDHGLSTPLSASSSNMACTPPLDWRMVLESHDADGPNGKPRPKGMDCRLPAFSEMQGISPTIDLDDSTFNQWHEPMDTVEPSTLSNTCTSSPSQPSSSHYQYSHNIPPIKARVHPNAPSFHPSVSIPAASMSPSTTSPIIQPPLKLHQTRPCRRIPIVSLSTLALACDTFQTNPQGRVSKPDSSDHSLSPLTQKPNGNHVKQGSPQYNRGYEISSRDTGHDVYSPTFGNLFTGEPNQVILCHCGCMESYSFPY